ncbi:MAG: hypothetical protein Q4F02_03705 [Candidatus Saccharibacteria bacterium]|nr:hypothetical protein [Candidatus Saccharibacteria bacterium]
MSEESLTWAALAFLASIPLFAVIVAATEGEGALDERLKKLRKRLGVLAVLYCIANMTVFTFSLSRAFSVERTHETEYATAAAHFGLQSGVQYPLQLGSRFAGTSGEMSVNGGIFSVYGEGSWSPATAVSLGFENPDGRSWILEIPVSRITFVQDAGAKPNVLINLNGSSYDPEFKATIDHGGCHLKIEWGWWLCAAGEPKVALSVSDDAERAGLAPIVAQAFSDGGSSATITLTPQQYDALLKDG